MPPTASLPEDLVRRLADVRSVGVITGAGVSKESGIQTYRGDGGLYDDPEEGDRTVEALSGSTFRRDPDRTWSVLAKLAAVAREARPNAAHDAIAAIEDKVERFALLTQNVDGLHRRAGSRNVIEIHGNVFDTLCLKCGASGELTPALLSDLEAAPRCETCGSVLRPQVVLFEEMLPPEAVRRLQHEFYDRMPDLVLTVGTSGMFPYILEPTFTARRAGKLTIEVNPERSEVSDFVDFWLAGEAGVYVPLLAEVLG